MARLGIRGKTVLLAERSAADRQQAQEILRALGAGVRVLNDPRELVDSQWVDGLLLLGADFGPGLLSTLQQFEREVSGPTVVLSSNPSEEEHTAAVLAGAIGYLRKPISAKSLLRCLEGLGSTGP